MKESIVSAYVENKYKNLKQKIYFKKLGIPVSVVINSLYRQIIYQRWYSILINTSFRATNH